MQEQVFDQCHTINRLLISNRENEARQELIKLLDYHNNNDLPYNPLVYHFI